MMETGDAAGRPVSGLAACPKCASPCEPEALECLRCGVVFAKFEPRAPVVRPSVPSAANPPVHVVAAADHPTAADLVTAVDPVTPAVRVGRAFVLVGLGVWTWQFARAPMGAGVMDSFLHLPDLVFHEAGHVLFSPFGHFMTVLGGSLFQVLVPIVFAGAFLKQRDTFGAVVCTWWAGQNLLDLAPYIADSRALQLVLLGGHTGAEVEGHDWEYLLTALGWLRHDRTLGLAAHRLGLIVMIGAVLWGTVHLGRSSSQNSDVSSQP
jgi:hypothetical protein